MILLKFSLFELCYFFCSTDQFSLLFVGQARSKLQHYCVSYITLKIILVKFIYVRCFVNVYNVYRENIP